MHRWLSPLVVILFLTAAPALAAPCKTQGAVDAPIAFPRNDAGDVPFARSMVAVMLPDISGALPSTLSCTRSTVSTALGDYAIGGENDDAFPRMALRADGKMGPVAYLAASRDAAGVFALVVHEGSRTTIKRFYSGIPTDQRLADDVRAALAGKTGIMSFDAERKTVSYAFAPPGGVPPPLKPGSRPGGTSAAAGPQILIESSGDPRLLDMAGGMKHTPSGFACPETFDSLPVLLMSIDPRIDTLSCSYRAGTELRIRKNDPIRYQITLIKASPGETPRGIFDELAASARASLHIKGEHAPPLAIGSAPAPEFVAYWDTRDTGVQGVWVGRAGGWIISLRAQYPPSPANDAEAGKVAQTLFSLAGKQVR
ncbi:MAG: hypothetical protein ABIS51_01420 [Sphingomonas sp.]